MSKYKITKTTNTKDGIDITELQCGSMIHLSTYIDWNYDSIWEELKDKEVGYWYVYDLSTHSVVDSSEMEQESTMSLSERIDALEREIGAKEDKLSDLKRQRQLEIKKRNIETHQFDGRFLKVVTMFCGEPHKTTYFNCIKCLESSSYYFVLGYEVCVDHDGEFLAKYDHSEHYAKFNKENNKITVLSDAEREDLHKNILENCSKQFENIFAKNPSYQQEHLDNMLYDLLID